MQPLPKLTPFEIAWKKRFEQFASAQSDAAIAGWSETGLQTRVRYFLHFWASNSSKGRWLDVGCGAGTYSQILSQGALETIGVDYSVPTLIKAKERYKEGIQWGAANVYQLPFKSQSFDGILCFGVLQAISDERSALKELKRVAKFQSDLWIDGLNKWCFVHWRHMIAERINRASVRLRYVSPYVLIKDVPGAAVYWLPILPHRLYRLQRYLCYPATIWVWQRLSWITRFFSHSFLIHIESSYV